MLVLSDAYSVIQALFAVASFRKNILELDLSSPFVRENSLVSSVNNTPQTDSFKEVFALLSLSHRSAISPSKFARLLIARQKALLPTGS